MTFYSNISGITRSDFKHTILTAAQYDGLARPGELVVDLTTYQLYIGNATGNLNQVVSGGGTVSTGGISNGTTSISVPQVNGNIAISVGSNNWSFDTNGRLNSPSVNNTQISLSGASTIVKGNPYTVYGVSGISSIVYQASSDKIVACKILLRLQYVTNNGVELIEINAVKSINGSSVDSTISHIISSPSVLTSQINVGVNASNQITITAISQNGYDFYSTYKATEFERTQ